MHGEQTIKRLNSEEHCEVKATMDAHAKPHTDPFAAVAAEAIAKHTGTHEAIASGVQSD